MASKLNVNNLNSDNGKISIVNTDLLDLSQSSNGIILPSGNNLEEVNPENRAIRLNTEENKLKVYSSTNEWKELVDINSEFASRKFGIVRSDLVFYVNAADSSSYPGVGNEWYDTSGFGHVITLGPQVTFVSDFGGVLNFAENSEGYGRNDTFDLSTSDFTVVTWVRKNSNGNNGRTVTALNNNWLLGHHDTTYGDYYANGWVETGVATSDTVWRMYTGTGNLSTDIYELYINDTLTTVNSGGSAGPSGWNLNAQYGQYSDCQIANILCYDRVLTQQEITKNYNALRSRFT